MKTFKQFLTELKHPLWVRMTTTALLLQIRKLSQQIEQEKDEVTQNKLIARQNKLLAYMNGLGIGIGTDDTTLLKRLKSGK